MFTYSKFSYAASVGMLSFSLNAATLPPNNVEQENSSQNIEVINVYAQKRSQDINDVSVAVTVIDSDSIDNWHLKDSTQLATLVPNVKMTNNAGEGTPPAFNIRGVGMIDYNTSTISPIAIYSDGVVGGSANNLSVNLFDLEHVEVLRGPQGTLFGRNTTGGAILLRSRQPDNEFGGYIKASVAEHEHRSFDGALNVPLSDNTAMRMAINHEDYQFSVNNLMPGSPDGGLKQTNFRMIVKSEWDDVTLTTKLHTENWRGSPKPIASLGINKVGTDQRCTPNQAGTSGCADNFGVEVGGSDFWDVRADTADKRHDTDRWGGSVKVDWNVSPTVNFTSVTAYSDMERFHSWDSDGPGNFIEGSMGLDNTLFSQEFMLSMQFGQHYWISGLFYVNEDINQKNDIDLFRDFRAIPELAAIPAQFFYDNQLENTSTALYSQIDFTLSDKLVLTAGLRYTDESTDYHALADLDLVPVYIPGFWDLTGEIQDDELSGKLALTQQLSDTSSMYYSYSRGYKSGGYNAGYTSSPEQAADSEYAPEKLNAYEVGMRTELWQRVGNMHLAAFYYDYKDQQVFVNMTTGAAPYHVLKNAGDSTIYGFEAELSVTPTDNMQVNIDIGYLPKANIGKYQQGSVTVDDNRLPFASKWNVSGYILYENELFNGRLVSQLGFDYQSDFYFDQNENPYTEQEGFIVWNGRATYYVNEQIELSLWGKNLTNTEHSELRFDSIAALGAVTELKAEARQVGVAVSYSF